METTEEAKHDVNEAPPRAGGGCAGGTGSGLCECANWATTNLRGILLTGHHDLCPNRPSGMDCALVLISDLASGMEAWAADEDGIHPDAWAAYRRAKALEGVFLPEDPDAPNVPISDRAK